MPQTKPKEKTLEERFDDYFKRRARLTATYFAKSDQLQDEYDALMAELEESDG